MATIDLEKFICSVMQHAKSGGKITRGGIRESLADQGLEYKNGSIMEICGNDGGISPNFHYPATEEETSHEPKFKVGQYVYIKTKDVYGTVKEINCVHNYLIRTEDWEMWFYENSLEDAAKENDGQKELAEFEKAVYDCAWGKVTTKLEGETKEEYAKRHADLLLSLARKQIVGEINAVMFQMVNDRMKPYNRWSVNWNLLRNMYLLHQPDYSRFLHVNNR